MTLRFHRIPRLRAYFGRLGLHAFGRALQEGDDAEVPFVAVGRLVVFLDTPK